MISPYPNTLETLGDHLLKRRLDLGLRQIDVARELGTNEMTVVNWEKNYSKPRLSFIPSIIKFLGYSPLSGGTTLGERLGVYRLERGLTLRELARRLGVDPASIRRWESGRKIGSREKEQRVENYLAKVSLKCE